MKERRLWLHGSHRNKCTIVLSFLLVLNREYVPSSNVLTANIISILINENRNGLFFHNFNQEIQSLPLPSICWVFFFASRQGLVIIRPGCQWRQAHQDGFGTAISFKPELCSAVINKIEFCVPSAPDQLPFLLPVSKSLASVPVYNF